MPASQPIIEVSHLSKVYPGVHAVNDLSFTVQEGDVYGFLGQNGAGKSTTIRMLLTLVKPTSGQIRMFGKDLSTDRHGILSQTGAIIERPDMYKYLSAFDNLKIFARMSGKRVTRAFLMERLDMVGLAGRWNSAVKTFSQGMKQRLGIAVSLIHDPRLVLLDEPTNGLDPQGIADMRKLIISLRKEMGKTVLVSSHLLSEIEQVATRMIIINKGSRIAEGSVNELLSPANTVVTIETLDNAQALALIHQEYPLLQPCIEGTQLRVNMDKARVPELVGRLAASGNGIVSVKPRHSLEEYFLSLTNLGQHVEPVADRTV